MRVLPFLLASLFSALHAADWPQDAGNAQRTGWTAEEPELPWTFAWVWNTPDAPGGHRYHQPKPNEPWEARVVVGGGLVFAPAGELGVFALRLADGGIAWQFQGAACHVSPVFDAENGVVLIGTSGGAVIKLRASDGTQLGRYDASDPITKSLLLADGALFVLTKPGSLHRIDPRTMRAAWTHASRAAAATPPAYSGRTKTIVFCTEDLQVHAVDAVHGASRWKVRPTPLSPQDGSHSVEFTGGWPVIAENEGIVFVRLAHSNIERVLWTGGGPKGKWPETSALIRERLVRNPELQNLFALRLTDGSAAFIPAIGPAGVEDLRDGRPRLRVGSMPVVRERGGRDYAYLPWRNGDTRDAKWDARWDSHLGEMTLAPDATLAAGDMRFVKFGEHGGWVHITDESCPLTMAGETLFHAHWDASTAARISDRSSGLGLQRATPIATEKRPPVARHIQSPQPLNPATHWHAGGIKLMDGRWLDGPGWWVYAGALDIPTPAREAYSEGILPRYTVVAGGHIIVQGNGGDLLVLRHSGRSSR